MPPEPQAQCLGYGSGNPDLDPSVFNKFEGTDQGSDQNPDLVPPNLHVFGRPGRGFGCLSASNGSFYHE